MKPSDEELNEIGCDRNSKRKKPRVSSMSSMSDGGGGGVSSLQDALDKRNDIALMKEENKKRKLLLYEKKIEADAKKMEDIFVFQFASGDPGGGRLNPPNKMSDWG